MMQFRYNRKKGFTLIEVIVYVAVLVLISGAVITTYLSLDTVLLRNKTERELTKAADIVLETLVREIRAATNVNVAERVLPDELALDQSISTTTEFYLSSSTLYMDVNNETVGPLTTSDVTVENIQFYRYQNTGNSVESEMIRVELTLSVSSRAASTTRTFYTGAVLRGSYD